MKIFKYHFLAYIFFATSFLFAANDPSIKIKETSKNVLDILYSHSQNVEDDILNYLSANFNLDIIIRRTLGRNWGKIIPEHQDQILGLIKRLVLRAYIDGMNGQKRPDIKYFDTLYLSKNRAEVLTSINFSNNRISLTYRLGLVSGHWEIFDLVVENVSIVLTYRTQFDSFFYNNTSEALIKKLETLLANENLGETLPI